MLKPGLQTVKGVSLNGTTYYSFLTRYVKNHWDSEYRFQFVFKNFHIFSHKANISWMWINLQLYASAMG